MTLFVANIKCLACETKDSNMNKCMFLLIKLCPEVRGMMLYGVTYRVFDPMVYATIGADHVLQFEAQCART